MIINFMHKTAHEIRMCLFCVALADIFGLKGFFAQDEGKYVTKVDAGPK